MNNDNIVEYRLLATITYKNKKFKVLSNKKYQKYFLRVLEDGKLMYPTLEEFKELYKIYCAQEILYSISDEKDENNVNTKRKYKIIPKVIFKKTLISLTYAMLILGSCKMIKELKSEETQETLLEHNGVNVEKLPEDMLEIKNYYNEDYNKQEIFSHNLDEFRNYVEVKNPTYDDLRKAVEENKNIDGEYKKWMYEGINQLEKHCEDLDLVVLYHNLTKMKIIEKSPSEIKEKIGTDVNGYYIPKNSNVIINEETIDKKRTFYHEVFGHGITETIINNDDNIIEQSMRSDIVSLEKKEDDNKYYMQISSLCSGLEEAKADIITKIITGEYQNSCAYSRELKNLRVFMELTNTSLEELIKNGTTELINKMAKNSITSPISYIEVVDMWASVNMPTEFITLTDNLTEFFIDYTENEIKKGENLQDIINDIDNIMDNSQYIEISSEKFAYTDELTQVEEQIIGEIEDKYMEKDENEIERD